MWRVAQKMVLLCLALILPLQGMAARLPHACLYKQAQAHLARQDGLSAQSGQAMIARDQQTSRHKVPYQVCLAEKGGTWAVANFKLAFVTARLAGRHPPGAESRFTSHILLQPRRPPRSFAL